QFEWSGEMFGGAWMYPGSPGRVTPLVELIGGRDESSAATQNYQLTFSGPALLLKTTYLLNARRYSSDDYLHGFRIFNVTDRRDSLGQYHPTGDLEEVVLGYSRQWSGLVKIANRSIPHVELSYQAVVNDEKGQRASRLFELNPDGRSVQRTFSVTHGLDWSQTLSKTTFYKLGLRQNYFKYRDGAYEDLDDPRYDAAGGLQSNQDVDFGAYTSGVDFARFLQKTNAAVLVGSLSSQVNPDHFMKLGGEVEYPVLQFGNRGNLKFNQEGGRETLIRDAAPGVREFRPWIWSIYGQDEAELNDLRLRAGLRLEYFDPVAALPSDLANPANAIDSVPASHPRSATRKYSLMPRLGVSFPITPSATMFFAYGHFTQMPPLGDIYRNSDYSVLSTLQAGLGGSFGLLGNPDIKPERTVQYQFGYKQAVSDAVGLDVTLFYKDIRDLLGL